mmetsp:Transcript_60418/g.135936  ORF Transcript_60418/g.135936 Transcript_60418/m.135936 type:complete len:228 (-) Transcript_60418:294-977(-)
MPWAASVAWPASPLPKARAPHAELPEELQAPHTALARDVPRRARAAACPSRPAHAPSMTRLFQRGAHVARSPVRPRWQQCKARRARCRYQPPTQVDRHLAANEEPALARRRTPRTRWSSRCRRSDPVTSPPAREQHAVSARSLWSERCPRRPPAPLGPAAAARGSAAVAVEPSSPLATAPRAAQPTSRAVWPPGSLACLRRAGRPASRARRGASRGCSVHHRQHWGQ